MKKDHKIYRETAVTEMKKEKKKRKNIVSESLAREKVYGEENIFSAKPFQNISGGNYEGGDPAFGKEEAQKLAAGIIGGRVGKKASSSGKSPYAGHRQRLRARYLQAGSDGMTDYDVLELLLTYSIPQRDVKPLARTLLDKFSTLGGVFDAEMEEICAISGISENSALLFRILRDLCSRYLKEKMQDHSVLDSPAAVEDYARMKLGGYREEVMMVIFVNTCNHVIDSHILAKGTVDCAIVYPRNIAAEALLKKASGVILVHNHPSGCVSPSREDIEFTAAVKSSLASLEIRLLDHLIVSRNHVCSFHHEKLLP